MIETYISVIAARLIVLFFMCKHTSIYSFVRSPPSVNGWMFDTSSIVEEKVQGVH